MILRKKVLVIAAYAFLLFPILLFFIGWLNWYVGIPAALLLVVGFIWVYLKDYKAEQESIRISFGHLIAIVVFFGLVVAISGVAGVGVSGYDTPARNAIYHDVIDYSWPVIYENGNALVYYCTFWLPPALIGKLLGWVGGLFALWVYITMIVTVSYLLILSYLKVTAPGKMWLVGVGMILFSGMSFLAAALLTAWGTTDYPLLTLGAAYLDWQFNGEAFNWHYRANIETLQMIYNQLFLWVAVPLMLHKRTVHSYMFLGLLVLPYSPWGFLGIIPLLLVAALPYVKDLVTKHCYRQLLLEIFSPANVIALVTVVPIFASYFLASIQTGGSASATLVTPDQVAFIQAKGGHYTLQTGAFGFLSWDRFTLKLVIGLIFFYLIEFGVYMTLIYPKYKREPLFWGVLVCLLLSPLIWVGTVNGRDFCQNGSLPALFVLMIMLLRYIKDEVAGKPFAMRSLCLTLALTIAATGSIYSLLDKVHVLKQQQTFSVINDDIKTFSDKPAGEGYQNFVSDKLDTRFFFKYLARRE